MGHVAYRLDKLFIFLASHLVQQQGEQNRRRKSENKIFQVNAEGVADQPLKIYTLKKFAEML